MKGGVKREVTGKLDWADVHTALRIVSHYPLKYAPYPRGIHFLDSSLVHARESFTMARQEAGLSAHSLVSWNDMTKSEDAIGHRVS